MRVSLNEAQINVNSIVIFRKTSERRSKEKFVRAYGVTKRQFKKLAKEVGALIEQKKQNEKNNNLRNRKPGGGRNPTFSVEEKLRICLYYCKQGNTQESVAKTFNTSQSAVSRIVNQIAPLLEEAADPVLHNRMEKTKDEFQETGKYFLDKTMFCIQNPSLKSVAIDVTECPCYRSCNNEEQKKYYSGKRKKHTIKQQVTVSLDTKEIVDVSDAYPGSCHDKRILDLEKTMVQKTSTFSACWFDKAYTGLDKQNPDKDIFIPTKKKKVRTYQKSKKLPTEAKTKEELL